MSAAVISKSQGNYASSLQRSVLTHKFCSQKIAYGSKNRANANESLESTAARLPTARGRATADPLHGSIMPPNRRSGRYAYGDMTRSFNTMVATEAAAGNVATAKMTSKSAACKPRARSGCIHIGGGFIPPHEYAAMSRPKASFTVGSPPWQRLERRRLAMKYDPLYR